MKYLEGDEFRGVVGIPTIRRERPNVAVWIAFLVWLIGILAFGLIMTNRTALEGVMHFERIARRWEREDVPEGHWKLAGGEASAASGNHRNCVPPRVRPGGAGIARKYVLPPFRGGILC